MFKRITRRVSNRTNAMKDTTIRDFSGGLNVADNDLNLSSAFAVTLDNMTRKADGSIGLRFGTKVYTMLDNKSPITGTLPTDPLDTTNTSAVIVVNWTAHGLLNGHSVTLSSFTTTNGIPAGEINDTHIVDSITADTFEITVTTTATSTGSGGGDGSYSYDNQNLATDIVFCEGFQDKVIAVDKSGNIALVDANGNSVIIWSEDIAQTTLSTAGWSALTFVTASQYGRQLTLSNGIDKPLLVDLDNTHPVTYLEDLGSSSNTNTPIGRYSATVGKFLIIAGIPTKLSTISISNTATSGTFLGDPNPNDAVEVDISQYVDIRDPEITGLTEFRGQLLVMFDDTVVPVQLGVYNSSSEHTPVVGESIRKHGTLAHHSIQNIGNDCFLVDDIGVPSIRRASLDLSFRPKRVSRFVDPLIQAALSPLSVGTLEDRVLSVYNKNAGQYMVFIPNNDTEGATTETFCFVYTLIEELGVKVWSRWRGWNWRAVGTTPLGRVIMATGRRIYILGTDDDPYYADLINDPDIDEPTTGDGIEFDWMLPWGDFGRRGVRKDIEYIKFDTKGTAEFTCRLYVDNLMVDENDADSPVLSMSFVGGDTVGFGQGSQPFGGGRNTSDEQLWEFPSECAIARLRISGTATENIQFIAIILYYMMGSIRR